MDTNPPMRNSAGASRLAAPERGEDLEEAADERPDPHDQHQYQRGGPGPDQGDHPGGQVDHCQQQVADDRPGGASGEGPHRLYPGRDEGVDREQDDQCQNRHPGPGEGEDPDHNGENAKQNHRRGR
jgi:hypothetical protein